MRAGELDKQITFETRTTATDDFGGEMEAFGAPFTAWAKVTFGTGQERRAAAQEQGSQAATFQVRRWSQTDTVTVRDRIVFDGARWDIESRAAIGRDRLDFTATRAA